MNKQTLRIAVPIILIALIGADLWGGFSRRWLDDYVKHRALFLSQTEDIEYENHWLGVRLQQYPADLQTYEELLYKVRPDIIIETGTFYGGSALFLADIMEHINPDAPIVTIDITDEYLNKTKAAGQWRPALAKKIHFIKGDSVGDETLAQVEKLAAGKKRVIVLLDSLHTADHVKKELDRYSPLVSPGSYILVNDTHHDTLSTAHEGEGPLAAAQYFEKLDNDFELVPDLPRYSISAMHHGIFRRKGELPPVDVFSAAEPAPANNAPAAAAANTAGGTNGTNNAP